MYTLSDFIGKDVFNSALGRFIDKFRYQSNPYTNIGEFVKTIREDTPDDLQYLITDTFEKITLYENKAKEASAVENGDGTFTVTMEVEAKKEECTVSTLTMMAIFLIIEECLRGPLGIVLEVRVASYMGCSACFHSRSI